jgi:hypothetical protein
MFVLNRRAKITELKHLEQNHHFASQQRYKRFLRPPYLSITDIVYKKNLTTVTVVTQKKLLGGGGSTFYRQSNWRTT